MPEKILVVTQDIFFWGRIHGVAKAAGADVVRVGDEAAMDEAFRQGGVKRLLADLGSRGVDVLAWAQRWKSVSPAPELVAYGSHVDSAGLDRARAAGFDRVMPNSRFDRELAELLK